MNATNSPLPTSRFKPLQDANLFPAAAIVLLQAADANQAFFTGRSVHSNHLGCSYF